MTLKSGSQLGSFEIISLLGSGGMGDVYKAKDLKLGRDVAIKVLKEELASDPERLRRFEQEARSASALNHPNIVTIYDIGRHGSTPYIAMELVEGRTLREVVSEGRLSTKKLLPLAVQIADGLGKAHSAGIVHRDLKPENIMLASDGFVKILDFGLAKLVPTLSEEGSDMVTMTKEGTLPGTVVGTVGYMSPEQAQGQVVDYRSDQFAFGSILYEMATGKRAFQRDSSVQTLSSIIEDEPASIASLNPKAPAHLRAIVDRCLEKKPEDRYDSTRDLARDLKSVTETPVEPAMEATPPPAPRSRHRLLYSTVAVLLLVLVSALAFNFAGLRDRLFGKGASKPIESIAVLPLENLSGDPEEEFFADGMTEALIADLAKIGSLKVISRTSAMRYRGTDKSLPEIATELNVDGIVEGSIVRAGGRVRITAQLIEAATDQHIWAETYERDLRDVLSLQSEVARAISQEIQVTLTPREEQRLTATRTVSPEAHEAYLMGRYHWDKFTAEGINQAIQSFRRAIEIDPSYALAYSGLADSYLQAGFWGFVRPQDVMPQGKAAALRSVELDDSSAEAHNSLAAYRFWYDWDWGAGSDFEKAIELNPGYALARFWYAEYLGVMGRLEESMEQARRARELDPLSPIINNCYASVLHDMQRYDEAIEQYKRSLELDPNFFPVYWALAGTYTAKGMYEEAYEQRKKAVALLGNIDVVEAMEQGYLDSGLKGADLAQAEKRAEQSRTRYIPSTSIAFAYCRAEETEKCLEWLERAYEERSMVLVYLRVPDPDIEWLQDHPQFQDLLRRMNFPE